MEKIYEVLRKARLGWFPAENYWIYFKKDGSAVEVNAEEDKRDGWLGFFVEDDTRLPGIVNIAERKTKWRKM